MVIESVDLMNYRNYEMMKLQFDAKTNIIYGDNAQGKTNILESLYVCATSKSHRGSKDKEMITFGQEEAHIKVHVCKNKIPYRIDMHLKKNRSKGIAVNGIPIKKAIELFGIINIVFFSPEDLNIIKNGPSERRRFLDMELGQVDKIYLNSLINYNKVVIQRNKLLKELSFACDRDTLATLDIWDLQLVKYGTEVIRARNTFIRRLSSLVGEIHHKLSGGVEQLALQYAPCITPEQFSAAVAASRERDIRLKTTNIGPHKDDMVFFINENDARKYGSQGQQRTAALALKLAELELVKQLIRDTPVLLLDDVLSELDGNRQNFLLNSIGDLQTIVTCTGLDEFINNRFAINSVFKVVSGMVRKEN